MIIGLGSDLCNIERIANSLDRYGDRFLQRVFTAQEQAKAARRPHTRAGTLAKRFAAKEAFAKAVGTGFKQGVFMRDIGVVNAPPGSDNAGAPTLHLTGGAAARLAAITPAGHTPIVHLTLTDDHPWAQAFVVLEARADTHTAVLEARPVSNEAAPEARPVIAARQIAPATPAEDPAP
jgi:holo-[acyl-carrier protein] synthase